jgi:hypothetical protein
MYNNRSSALASSLAEQARQPAVEPLNSPLATRKEKILCSLVITDWDS